jgi:predicted SprT family Zn-dependent metalloprotease
MREEITAPSARDIPEIASWTRAWNLAGIEDRITITASSRLRNGLANCDPHKRLIRVRADLLGGTRKRLLETFCHEMAHIVVYELYGRAARPHGPEWRSLVSAAGFEPRTRIPLERATDGSHPVMSEIRATSYEHRCPVCQATRRAKRPVTRWRCSACRAIGLDGRMLITRIDRGGIQGT